MFERSDNDRLTSSHAIRNYNVAVIINKYFAVLKVSLSPLFANSAPQSFISDLQCPAVSCSAPENLTSCQPRTITASNSFRGTDGLLLLLMLSSACLATPRPPSLGCGGWCRRHGWLSVGHHATAKGHRRAT